MTTKFSVTVLVSILAASSANLLGDEVLTSDRKIWSQCYSTDNCSCGVQLGKAVLCSQNGAHLSVQPCYCLYYDLKRNITLAGPCLYTCFYPRRSAHDASYSIYRYSIHNYSHFNEDMCNSKIQLNRRGRFCGRCKPDYGFPVYSSDTACIPCKNTSYKNWLKYLAIALGPLTVFYILVVIFRASMPTSQLNGMLFVIQCITSPAQVQYFYMWASSTSTINKGAFKVIFSVLGLANLNFFREVYPNFCLNSEYKILDIKSLDLLVALYPFVLILITYFLVSLYNRNCHPIVSLWQYLKRSLNPILRKSVHISLTETFATFILLTSVKVTGLSFDLLMYTRTYQENGTTGGIYTFYDANVAYFGKEHQLAAILAIVSSFAFAVLPFLLLFLYPSCCFQRLLNYFNIRSHALHIFMEAFQGSYKTKPLDLRYFAAWYLLLRFLFLLFVGFFNSILSVTMASFIMILVALSIAFLKPYTNDHSNTRDIVLLLSAAFLYGSIAATLAAASMDFGNLPVAQNITGLSIVLIIIVTCLSMFWYPITRLLQLLYERAKLKFRRRELILNETNSYKTFSGGLRPTICDN